MSKNIAEKKEKLEQSVRFSVNEASKYFKMVYWFRTHICHAMYLLFGVELTAHERIVARRTMEEHTSSIVWWLSRGMAKTTMLYLLANYIALLWSGAEIPLLGPDFRRGKRLFTEYEKYLLGEQRGMEPTDFIYSSIRRVRGGAFLRKGADMWSVTYKNGSTLFTGPLIGGRLRDRSRIRGMRATYFMATDESADISENLWNKVIRPFGRVRDWAGERYKLKIVQAGTMDVGGSRFHKTALFHRNNCIENNEYLFMEFNYKDAFWLPKGEELTVGNYREKIKEGKISYTYPFDLVGIMQELEEGSDYYSFLLENRNILLSTPDRVYPPYLINKAVGVRNEDGELVEEEVGGRWLLPGAVELLEYSDFETYIGVDVARSDFNYSACVVLAKNKMLEELFNLKDIWTIASVKMYKNVEFKVLAEEILALLERFPNTKRVVMDKRGGGMAVADILKQGAVDSNGNWIYLPVYDINFIDEIIPNGRDILTLDASTDVVNEQRAMYLRSMLERRRLLLPYWQVSVSEAEVLTEEYGNLRELIKQLQNIKSSPTSQASKYYVEIGGNKDYCKDLFSALLLACEGIRGVPTSEGGPEGWGIWI